MAERRAFDEGPWPRLKATERGLAVRNIAEAIRRRADELIAREVADIRMPIAQMKQLAARAAENFDYDAGVVTELHGRTFQAGDEFLNYTIRKPVGVAGLIMRRDTPLMLPTCRIAPALAAGNTIVLKPAEWSPRSSTLLAEVLAHAGVPDGVFKFVDGFGASAAAELSGHVRPTPSVRTAGCRPRPCRVGASSRSRDLDWTCHHVRERSYRFAYG